MCGCAHVVVMHAHVHACMCLCVHVCVRLCVYVCMCAHVRGHARLFKHAHKPTAEYICM